MASINMPQFVLTIHQLLKTFGSNFIAAGDYNAKHTFWGSRLVTLRDRQLLDAIYSGCFVCGSPCIQAHRPQ